MLSSLSVTTHAVVLVQNFIFFSMPFCLLSLDQIRPFSVLLTPFLFSLLSVSQTLTLSSDAPSPLSPMILPHSLHLILAFLLFPLYSPCALSFLSIPPSTLSRLLSLLYCPLYFSPSVLFSSSSLLHHKVDGWMIHLSLCPRTVVILILLHS